MLNNRPPIRIESICIVHKNDSELDEDEMPMIGIFVEAEVSYPISVFQIYNQKYNEHRRIEWFKSAGLWGIAADSSFDGMVEIEKEQLADLKTHLSVFGVDISNFKQIKYQMRRE